MTTRYRMLYRPEVRSRLADIVAQVMVAERLTPTTLADRAGYSRQTVYAAFSDDRRGIHEFRYPLAVHLLGAMGYQLEMRAVPRD